MQYIHLCLAIFLGVAVIPVSLLVKYRTLRNLGYGLLLVFWGTALLSSAILLDYLQTCSTELKLCQEISKSITVMGIYLKIMLS